MKWKIHYMKHPAKVHTKQQQTHLDIKHRYSWPLDMCKGTYKSIYTQTLCMRLERKVFPLHRGTRMWNDERTSMKPQKKLILYDFSTKMWFDRNFPESFALFSFSPHFLPTYKLHRLLHTWTGKKLNTHFPCAGSLSDIFYVCARKS